MADERAMTVARRAAELLPEPPAAHDCFGYLAWEELVLSTARRLQAFLDDETLLRPPSVATAPLTATAGRLDAAALLTLAVRLAHEDDESCTALLAATAAASADVVSGLAVA